MRNKNGFQYSCHTMLWSFNEDLQTHNHRGHMGIHFNRMGM